MKDEKLEMLSDKVRMGESISFLEAIEVIEYQQKLKDKKRKGLFKRFINKFK